MKILVVHQYYLGPGEPGGSRFNEFAKEWAAAGHRVTIVAGSLNYATGVVPPHLKGVWNWHGQERGVDVWRCHVPSTYNNSYLGRMWAFFAFTLSALTAVARAGRPDVIIATSPPLTTGPVGWFGSLWHQVPWVLEIRDLWPESAITTGVLAKGSVLVRVLYWIERFCCRDADKVNVLTPAFRQDLVDRGLAAPDKIVFVPNGADTDAFVPSERLNAVREAHGWGHKCVALYAGAHGRANALMQLVDAADSLRQHPDIVIVSVGDGPERETCEQSARDRGLTNIQFIGAKPKEEMPDYVNASDIGLAVLQDNPTFRTVYPNKVFDYMACAKPVVLAIDGAARQLVCDEAQAGVFARPEDGIAIAKAIECLAHDLERRLALGQSGRRWVEQRASRAALADRYIGVLQEICCR